MDSPRARQGCWTYWEESDTSAMFWGMTVIGNAGLCLSFPEFLTRFLPGWAISVAHDIWAMADTHWRVHPLILRTTCKSCHISVNLVTRHESLREAPVLLYENSIHDSAGNEER